MFGAFSIEPLHPSSGMCPHTKHFQTALPREITNKCHRNLQPNSRPFSTQLMTLSSAVFYGSEENFLFDTKPQLQVIPRPERSQ